jgi:hypothetical protein
MPSYFNNFGYKNVKVLFCPLLFDIRKNIELFKGSLVMAACTSGKSGTEGFVWSNIGMIL